MGIVSVSHCWESMEHPDPWGSQLHTLLKQIDRPRFDGKSWAERYDELWVFIDFICLPQYPRTEEEQRHFKRAMGSMHVLYAHRAVHHVIRLEKLTSEIQKQLSPTAINIYDSESGKMEARPVNKLKLNDTPYFLRGWCIAEVQWTGTRNKVDGFAPMSPSDFRACVERGEKGLADGLFLKFTHRSDAELVMQLQENVWVEHAVKRTELGAMRLPQSELLVLADALQHFVNLRRLVLQQCQSFAKDGAAALAHGMTFLRYIEDFGVQETEIDDDCVAALAPAFRACSSLTRIWLTRCRIGDAGAAALGAVFVDCKNLVDFDLSGNNIGDVGTAALDAARQQTRKNLQRRIR